MTEKLEIGPAPPDEECVQADAPMYFDRASRECRRYIDLIRETVGIEPEGAQLSIVTQRHDFGSYLEVAVRFDPGSSEAVDYAFHVESHGPLDWQGRGAKRWKRGGAFHEDHLR